MSSSNSNANSSTPATPAKPSDKQINLLAVIMQNVQGKPDINWANVAIQAGLKNERTAKETYRQMTKKFGWNGMGARSPSGPAAGNASDTTTPTKVRKRTGKVGTKSDKKVSGKKTKEEEEEEQEQEQEDDESGKDSV